ncbi:metallophosphoesterase family protein [Azospirillum brasilense]|uniref:metallophosphoesterase family protein n=1 Tax=Azospirillum brasilense TaxID=192 RepID=UPI000E6841B6|nr:metallophosphoesterase family protein [Azospirillum brasilense]NUB29630.1 metallophosphoesterase [Azospirillum brasilense]NUB36207.1 metallophosphoesterase [Azospirillum brasilense]RIW06003.1 metallophosphoesterase [Azospirillum brasilense]
MAVFFTSDTHFGHAGALGRFRRPFASVAEMDEAMAANWNATVGPDDVVWHLGDFALHRKPDAMEALLERLHGTKHLITGNNDGPATLALPGWASVQPYAEFPLGERRLVLCHYAFRTWNGMYKGALNLHGHSHGQLKGMPRQFDVGVDVWSFRPVTVEQILASRQRARNRE